MEMSPIHGPMQRKPNLLKLQGQPAQWSAHPTSTSGRPRSPFSSLQCCEWEEMDNLQRLQYKGKIRKMLGEEISKNT